MCFAPPKESRKWHYNHGMTGLFLKQQIKHSLHIWSREFVQNDDTYPQLPSEPRTKGRRRNAFLPHLRLKIITTRA